jgi:hypothetical protein
MYKQYVRKTVKLLHTYVKFIPHPRSLDGTSPPTEDMLKEFGFVEVNTAIANALTAIANTHPPPSLALSINNDHRVGSKLDQRS